MSHDGGRRYDAFVVRLWRDAGTGDVLRAEVEHVPSGALVRAAGVALGWVLDQIHTSLADPRTPAAPRSADVDPRIVVGPNSDRVAALDRASVVPHGGSRDVRVALPRLIERKGEQSSADV